VTLDDEACRLLDGKNFATVATIRADGGPHASVVWIAREQDTLVFSITSRRQKARNLARDPRVSVTVFDVSNPYESVEIRGTAELIDDPDKRLPKVLSRKYLGIDPPDESPEEARLIVRVIPERVVHFSV
jgi:PPOX class probable F420-dependent enzyme